MIYYRNCRNDDPPALVKIWNEAFTGRGAVILRTSSPLEHYVFSKPYFDPAGLFIEKGETVRWVGGDQEPTVTAFHPSNYNHELRIPENAKPFNSSRSMSPSVT